MFYLINFNELQHPALKFSILDIAFRILQKPSLFVCLLLNSKSALFKLLVSRIVEIKQIPTVQCGLSSLQ